MTQELISLLSPPLPRFNVLDRHERLDRHILLEASAGTGKTFAIENIVLRLLIESKGDELLFIEQILVVTFTRSAARDLNVRIRNALEMALKHIKAFLNDGDVAGNIADFLLSLFALGASEVKKAKRQIEEALFKFDQACIFTIHGFCHRMLTRFATASDMSLQATADENAPMAYEAIRRALLDFFETELNAGMFSQAQLSIVLGSCSHDIAMLCDHLMQVILRGVDIHPPRTLQEQMQSVKSAMNSLKTLHGLTKEKVMEAFYSLAPYFNEISDKSNEIHKKNKEAAENFAACFELSENSAFDLLVADGVYLLQAFDVSKLKKKFAFKAAEIENHPLLKILKMKLLHVVEEARNPSSLFARLASKAQEFILRFQCEEEIYGPSDLLHKMAKSLDMNQFPQCVRGLFKATIIDEFQDTDPLQWQIFSSLFLNPSFSWNGFLYLVGDPKQSIYAFREADIYTYLLAKKRLGESAVATLDTNFRSQASLVDALNIFFSSLHSLFPLPKEMTFLPFRPVVAGSCLQKVFKDGLANMQFWFSEKDAGEQETNLKSFEKNQLFPAIAKELRRLLKEDGIGHEKVAILTSDRYQAMRIRDYLQPCGIAAKLQRMKSLAKSDAVFALREVIEGILHYKDKSRLKLALGSRIIGISSESIASISIDNDLVLQKVMVQCELLKETLIEKGFGAFYTQLMQSNWEHFLGNQFFGDQFNTSLQISLQERMLSEIDGFSFYNELNHVAEILIGESLLRKSGVYAIVDFLRNFEDLENGGDDRVKAYIDPDEEGVSILTMHASKGLEFDIVFAVGLMNRSGKGDEFIFVEDSRKSNTKCLAAIVKDHPSYIAHCIESDAEKMRQLYVAMTRAKMRLYVPVAIPPSKGMVEMGKASPLELFLGRLQEFHSKEFYEQLYSRIGNLSFEPLKQLIDQNSSLMSYRHLCKEEFLSHDLTPSIDEVKNLVLPISPKISMAPSYLHSFTSLLHCDDSKITSDLLGLKSLAPHDCMADVKNAHTLPAGKETGILLHYLLETITFSSVLKETNSSCLIQEVKKALLQPSFSFLQGWEEVIAKILFQTLKTPLPGTYPAFCLAEVNPKKIYRESEFTYEQALSDHKMKGVIDLTFEHNGKYYLVDWKSNWLGSGIKHYNPSFLEAAMKDNHYDLQISLYKEAFKRYLNIFGIEFNTQFGGCYYLFLRGISPTTGIWSCRS